MEEQKNILENKKFKAENTLKDVVNYSSYTIYLIMGIVFLGFLSSIDSHDFNFLGLIIAPIVVLITVIFQLFVGVFIEISKSLKK